MKSLGKFGHDDDVVTKKEMQVPSLSVYAWFDGTFRNGYTKGVAVNVAVFYGDQKLDESQYSGVTWYRTNGVGDWNSETYKERIIWNDYKRNNTSLEQKVLVSYKGNTAMAYARLEHIIDGK